MQKIAAGAIVAVLLVLAFGAVGEVAAAEGAEKTEQVGYKPLPAGKVRIWDTMAKRSSFDAGWKGRDKWVQVPYGKLDYKFQGDPFLEGHNFWVAMRSRGRSGISIYAKMDATGTPSAHVKVYRSYDAPVTLSDGKYGGGERPGKIRCYGGLLAQVKILKNQADELVVESNARPHIRPGFKKGYSVNVSTTWRIPGGKSWVEIKPVRQVSELGLHGETRLAVCPEAGGNGNDAVADAHKHPEGCINMPTTGKMMFDCMIDRDVLLVMTWPNPAKAKPYNINCSGGARKGWAGIGEASPLIISSPFARFGDETEPVVIGVLVHGYWQYQKVARPVKAGRTITGNWKWAYKGRIRGSKWRAGKPWTPTHPGKWRLTGCIDSKYYTQEVVVTKADTTKDTFSFTAPVAGNLEYLIFYLYDRTDQTPKEVSTPMDIYREAILGTGAWGVVQGRVAETGEKPLAGARVTIGDFSGVTDKAGRFRVHVPPGDYKITARKAHFYPTFSRAISVRKDRKVSVNLEIMPLPIIRGRVIGVAGVAGGKPLADVKVTIGNFSDVTDEAGRFSLHVPAGDHKITARKADYYPVSKAISVREGRKVSVDLEIRPLPTGNIRARAVSADGVAITGVKITDGQRKSAETNKNGVCLLTDLPEGNYTVVAIKTGYIGELRTVTVKGKATTAANFTLRPAPRGLVGLWRFEAGSGQIAFDTAGGNHGTIHGTTWVKGKRGSALCFDGKTAGVTIPTSKVLDITDAVTIEAWVYPQRNNPLFSTIVAKGNLAYRLHTGWHNDVYFSITKPLPSKHPRHLNLDSAGRKLTANEWVHIVGTFDGSMMRMYLNGVLKNSMPARMKIGRCEDPLAIGENSVGGGCRRFTGIIDEVRLYDRALSDEEVKAAGAKDQDGGAKPWEHKITEDLHVKKYPGNKVMWDLLTKLSCEMYDNSLSEATSLEEWKKQRPAIRKRLVYMLGLDHALKEPPKSIVVARAEVGGCTAEIIAYRLYKGAAGHGLLILPKVVKKPLPLLIYGDHYNMPGGGAWAAIAMGIKRARDGYAVFVIDTMGHSSHSATFRDGKWWWFSHGQTEPGGNMLRYVRAIDYLCTRKEIDSRRIGVTGASGWGTYAWFITAVDDRIAAAAPAITIPSLKYSISEVELARVDGHNWKGLMSWCCDCGFFGNCYLCDLPQIRALCAPRPVLEITGEHDFGSFHTPAIHVKMGKIWDLYHKRNNLSMYRHQGTHSWGPKGRLRRDEWFDLHFKPVPNHSVSEYASVAKEVKAFERTLTFKNWNWKKVPDSWGLPNKKPEVLPFIKLARTPRIKNTMEWKRYRRKILADLKEKVFGGFPPRKCDLDVKWGRKVKGKDHIRQDVTFASECGVRLSARLSTPLKSGRAIPALLYINNSNREPVKLPPILAPLAEDHVILSLDVRGFGINRIGGIYRDNGAKSWPWFLQRCAPLVGRTFDSMRVWDVIRGVDFLMEEPRVDKKKIWVFGKLAVGLEELDDQKVTHGKITLGPSQKESDLGIVGLYAAVMDSRITRVFLDNPSTTYFKNNRTVYLNVLRILDVPQAAALVAPREVIFIGKMSNEFKWSKGIYKTLGTENNIRTGNLSE